MVDGRPEDAAADAREETRQQTGDAAPTHRRERGDGGRGERGDARGAGCGVGCRGRGPPCGPPGKPQGAQGPRAASRASPPLGLGPSTLDKLPSMW